MMTRAELRVASARYLNSIGPDELFGSFGITRIARIDGLDCIGVPVYSSCRPAAKCISVNAGKGVKREMARAGAVAEAIEFAIFENPTDNDPLTHYATNTPSELPPDLAWLRPKGKSALEWMRSSNGQALGATFEDAFLQGIYECVERDQVTLRKISIEKLRVYPPRVPVPVSELTEKIRAASLKLYLMHCSSDIPIPVYWAILVDPVGQAYAGWGCHLQHRIAMERAILESVQSRAVYIAGARDDILRRDFEMTHQRDPKQVIREMEIFPTLPSPPERNPRNLDLQVELSIVLTRLGPWCDQIHFKHIPINDYLHAVKVIILGMEQPQLTDKWRESRWASLRESYMSARACTA